MNRSTLTARLLTDHSTWRWLLMAALIVIYILSLVPVPPHGPNHFDKVEHFVVFFVLYLMAAYALPDRRALTLFVALAGYGLFIECSQALLPWRQWSLADWLADGLGALSAMALVFWRGRRKSLNAHGSIKVGRST